MSSQDVKQSDGSQPRIIDNPTIPEVKSRSTARNAKDKKKNRNKSRSRVIKDDEDVVSNDPDYSPCDELMDEGSGEISTCSTPVEEKLSSHESTPLSVVHPNSGSICALCYCGEKSLLGQGDLTRYDPTPGFNPFRKPVLKRGSRDSYSGVSPASDYGDRSSKSPSRNRSRETRHSRDSATKNSDNRNLNVVEELSMIGCVDIADPVNVFEPSGHVTAHHCCAAWSEGVTQNELYQLLCVDKAVHHGMSLRCSYCNRFGATIKCKATRCDKLFHYPCAAGSGCFQDIKSMLMLCSDHLEQAPSIGAPEELNCAVCDDMGEISDFLFCTSCGHHYHGNCLRPFVSVNPVVRAGWQCPDCKICQTCRQPGDDNKMLVCDSCDKGYHTYCLQPAMPFIPNNGWCCQNCRRCSDCGAKYNGGGSIWQCSEEVCDNCYKQRTKGSGCPVCGKAYSAKVIPDDMMQCNNCKKWVHEDCEDVIDMDTYCEMGSDYSCPKCRNEAADVDPSTAGPYRALERVPLDFMQAVAPPPDTPTLEVVADVKSEDLSVEAKAAKRSSMSSSLESDKSSSAMKGSSTDPMLFASRSSLTKTLSQNSDSEKLRHVSDETIAAVSQQVRTLVERKTSSEGPLVSILDDSETQDSLGLFSGDQFQPIVSVPMLYEDEQGSLHKDKAEWVKKKASKISLSEFPPKSIGKPGTDPSARQGMGKPGSMFGKGKPFGAKRKPAAPRSSKGKGYSRGKGRGGGRRQRQGNNVPSNAPNANSSMPSPTGAGLSGQVTSGTVGGTMGVRRRQRSRWHRQDSMVGALAPVETSREYDEEYGDSMHNTVVLCSADDQFTLNQDMCVVCGSFGVGVEGRLVGCSQCGQCYHPYCVNLKLTKVVLRKGWRCLDCTVCEECGAADDPSHLLLCDDCDISYHTYCLKPPLQHVPKGGWKCRWCVRCNHCGTTSPGVNCDWAENYTSCGPCASLTHCPLCKRLYRDEEIIMQCSVCERWLHSSCEYLYSESDIEKVLEKGYTCVFCRPKGVTPPHLDLNPPHAFEGDPSSGIYLGRTRSDAEQVKEYHKDGVALTSIGLQHIQQLMQNAMGLHKKKPNIQKRKSLVQKQAEKSTVVEIKPVLAAVNNVTGKESAVPLVVKENTISITDPTLADPSTAIKSESGTAALANLTTASETDIDEMTYTDALLSISDEQLTDKSKPLLYKPDGSQVVVQDEIVRASSDAVEGLLSPHHSITSTDLAKQPLHEVKQGGIKRRRKPYRPGIGGFMVRQRGRGGFMNPRSRRGRFNTTGAIMSTANVTGSTGFDVSPSKSDDVKLRATEITGECDSSYIKHDMEGGITIAHPDPLPSDGQQPVKVEGATDEKNESQTSVLVSPLKLKISNLPTTLQKVKRKRRTRLIDQFPPYIQEGFFGPAVLTQARSAGTNAIKLFEEHESKKRVNPYNNDSRIILPEKVKHHLDNQIARKTAEAKKKAELKHERLHARRLPSGDEDVLMMDKESEELLGVLPDDLPFKDDDILGILSGAQGQGGQDTHENILSPSSLEKMVTDGLASIDEDVNSLFSDVLNPSQDGATGTDEHGLLGDIGSLTEQPKAADTGSSTLQNVVGNTSSSTFEEPTEDMIDQIAAEHTQMLEQSVIVKSESQKAMMQKQTHLQQMLQAQQLQQQQQQQLQLQQHQQQQQQQQQQMQRQRMQHQANFQQQPQMIQSNVAMVQRHMYAEASGGDAANLSPQQQGQMQVVIQQQNQMHQHQNQLHQQQNKGLPVQQHQFIGSMGQTTVGLPQGLPSGPSLPSQPSDHITAPGMMSRQHSVDMPYSHSGSMNAQGATPQRVMTPGPVVQMFGSQSMGGTPPQMLSRPGSAIGNVPGSSIGNASVSQSVGLVTRIENTVSTVKPQGQVMANLPDLTSDSNIFEPAPPPWPLGTTDLDGDTLSVNQRNILKWEKDEPLGEFATISPVLYANIKHAHLKKDFPDWASRAKQVAKLWRKASAEERAPFLQKARDNRAQLKSSRRDDGSMNEQELMTMEFLDQDEEQKEPHQQAIPSQAQNMRPVMAEGSNLNPGKLQMLQQQMQMQQNAVKPGMTSSSPLTLQEYTNFAKPRPLSRDPTPKPQSPGVATSPLMVGPRSKSPFGGGVHPTSPVAGSARPRAPWKETHMVKSSMDMSQLQGQNIAQSQIIMNSGQQGWQNQQMQLNQHGVKIESHDSSGQTSSQVMRFPQPFHSSFPQSATVGGTPLPLASPTKPAALQQRRGSSHNLGMGQEQFLMRPVTPRPGMPPQLLPQVVSPTVNMPQAPVCPSPVSPHPAGYAMRGPVPPASQPTPPQQSGTVLDPFTDVSTEKAPHRRMSAGDPHQLIGLGTSQSIQGQNPVISQSTGTTASFGSTLPSVTEDRSTISEATDKVAPVPGGILQGTVGRPPVREALIRHTTQRRYKLLEQQTLPGGSWAAPSTTVITRPPPPYPSQSPIAQSPTQSSFVYPSNINQERFGTPHSQALPLSDHKIRGFRPPNMPPSPSYSPTMQSPLMPTSGNHASFGIERFPPRTSATVSASGVHPISTLNEAASQQRKLCVMSNKLSNDLYNSEKNLYVDV